MTHEDTDGDIALLAGPMGWQASLFAGIVTALLGLLVTVLPTQSLTVITVLIGVLMIISGIYQLVRLFDSGERQRVWHGLTALLFIVIGVVLIRHLHLSFAIIGLVIGITWIVQGISALMSGIAVRGASGAGWLIFFGVISLIAGIVVVSAPVSSVTALAVLVGIWFIVMGVMEIVGAFALRSAERSVARDESGDHATIPGQRPEPSDAAERRDARWHSAG
ncbi:MAG TPA: HdeD family acid-resistance protein [Trebonia sp.]|nr:HdeD family acid-resistance protein [Trebonia sp.]